MEMDETEQYHKNLNQGEDRKVDSVKYLVSPLKVKVYVSFIREYRCPICGDPCPGFDTHAREWRDLDYGRAKCDVVATIPRMK